MMVGPLLCAAVAAAADEPSQPGSWAECLRQEASWYRGAQAIRIADNVAALQRSSGGWSKNIEKLLVTMRDAEGRAAADSPGAVSTAGGLGRQIFAHTAGSQFRELFAPSFPLLPDDATQPPSDPRVKLAQDRRSLPEAEVTPPATKVAGEFLDDPFQARAAGPPRDVSPDADAAVLVVVMRCGAGRGSLRACGTGRGAEACGWPWLRPAARVRG